MSTHTQNETKTKSKLKAQIQERQWKCTYKLVNASEGVGHSRASTKAQSIASASSPEGVQIFIQKL